MQRLLSWISVFMINVNAYAGTALIGWRMVLLNVYPAALSADSNFTINLRLPRHMDTPLPPVHGVDRGKNLRRWKTAIKPEGIHIRESGEQW